jgi:hypothetical protein
MLMKYKDLKNMLSKNDMKKIMGGYPPSLCSTKCNCANGSHPDIIAYCAGGAPCQVIPGMVVWCPSGGSSISCEDSCQTGES